MRVGLLTKLQSADERPNRWLAKGVARRLERRGLANWIVTNKLLQECERRAVPQEVELVTNFIPRAPLVALHPHSVRPAARFYSLMLQYPPRPNETDGKRRQAELWRRAERF